MTVEDPISGQVNTLMTFAQVVRQSPATQGKISSNSISGGSTSGRRKSRPSHKGGVTIYLPNVRERSLSPLCPIDVTNIPVSPTLDMRMKALAVSELAKAENIFMSGYRFDQEMSEIESDEDNMERCSRRLSVVINCKAGEGDYQSRGVGKLEKDGKFTVKLPSELLREDGELKVHCFAQLHGGSKNAPCPTASGTIEAAKLVLTSRDGGQHTFSTAGKLSFSSETCAAAFFWHHPWFKPKYPYPPTVYPPVYKPPPIYSPPPVYNPPTPVYSPPVYTPPVYKPPPVYTPPIYKPPPVYTPPVYTPPVYKPPPVYTPPVYSPPPVYTPPAYKPTPFYKPPCPPISIYKPPIPKFHPFPPVYTKPWPTVVPKFPPVYPKPLPPFPPKYYPHPKSWFPPSYGWSPKYALPKHPFFPPSKVGNPKP
ncbi:hypothetical protein Taro_008777 [Colocasia esculenta]|uniref:Uncharacterized protein n=1 Tax=Colocasia esculenta TaxID=4460 RepID=A0A843U3Z8_COLES|nr:hypothetical protein [Colocasia esculenta]